MAVIVKYIVVRNGVEKMTFTTKKEADAYDKMLDIADNVFEFMGSAKLDIDEGILEDLSLFFAENKEEALSILKGIKPKPPAKKEAALAEPKTPAAKKKKASPPKAKK